MSLHVPKDCSNQDGEGQEAEEDMTELNERCHRSKAANDAIEDGSRSEGSRSEF